ncbi:MAG TPA: glycosyltransferase family 39 protein [Candidatus Bathyarchaeia archaeon]|nr:glycosyltransferase family 39 protein [Candidatus Bathyarchaeia archaeon]
MVVFMQSSVTTLTATSEENASSESVARGEKASFFAGGMLIVVAIAVAKFLLHFYFNNRYDYFRDEFDYVACGKHLAWGYVDQPPLIPVLIRICTAVFGDSLRSIRLIPAVASSALLVLTAMITRELGGRRFALVLSAVTVLIAPMYLSDGSLLTTNCLEPLLWMGCAYFAILAVKRDQPRNWLWFGVIAGIGLQEKYSIAVMGFGVVVGLLLTEQRRVFANKWIWLGGLSALLIFLPNLIWNVQNHFPFVELMHNIKADGRDVVLSPLQYFVQDALLLHPFTAPVWIAGVIALLVARRFQPYRFLGWCFVTAFTVFVALHGKNYYLAPIYPMLLAAGAVVIEDGIERVQKSWLKGVTLRVLFISGACLAPVVVPVLPIEGFVWFLGKLPFKVPASEHSHVRAAIPQHYADQFGWHEIVEETAVAYNKLAPAERRGCAIFAQDYGQAGAIDFFGPRYGLPPALSGHQTYFLWGPRGYSGNCMIVLDDTPEVLAQLFDSVEYVGTSQDNAYALEREIPVYICRGAKFGDLEKLWPRLKKWR